MLSIVTVTYNDPSGLARTVDSLRGLEVTEWQHVIVDSSPEANAAVLASLPPTWPLVHVCTPPRGIYAAMNEGIRASGGDVIWFLNGGDGLYSEEALSSALGLLSSGDGVDLVLNGVWPTLNGERLEECVLPGGHGRRVDDIRDALIGVNGWPHQGMLYRRDVFDRVGMYSEDYRIMADYEHHWRCMLGGIRGVSTELVIADYDNDGFSERNYLIWRREMSRLNVWLIPRLPPSLLLSHLRVDLGYSTVRTIRVAGRSVPLVRDVLRPIWRRIVPHLMPA